MTIESSGKQDPRDVAGKSLRRRRRRQRSTGARRQLSWDWLWDALALALAALALLTLLRLPPLAGFLGPPDVTLVTGLTLSVLSLSLGFVRVRARVNRRAHLWASYGCPSCQHLHLKRQRSRPYHRLARWAGIPLRRYICPECSWRGARVDDTHLG